MKSYSATNYSHDMLNSCITLYHILWVKLITSGGDDKEVIFTASRSLISLMGPVFHTPKGEPRSCARLFRLTSASGLDYNTMSPC